jgi:plasmid stabilization system protein ParE
VPRSIHVHPDFQRDLEAQLSWLAEHRGAEIVEQLRSGLDEALDLLAATPGVGSVQDRRGSRRLRKLILRRLPFLLWYTYDEERRDGELWLLRLFHVRQDRRRPR